MILGEGAKSIDAQLDVIGAIGPVIAGLCRRAGTWHAGHDLLGAWVCCACGESVWRGR